MWLQLVRHSRQSIRMKYNHGAGKQVMLKGTRAEGPSDRISGYALRQARTLAPDDDRSMTNRPVVAPTRDARVRPDE